MAGAKKDRAKATLTFPLSLSLSSFLLLFSYFQPIKSVRDAVVKAEKLKMEEKAKKETLERAKKEKKAASLPGKAPKWKPGQPIPTAAALGSTPPTNYQ